MVLQAFDAKNRQEVWKFQTQRKSSHAYHLGKWMASNISVSYTGLRRCSALWGGEMAD